MAVAPVTEPLLKSTPDMAKLNTFSGLTVTVTKHTAPRNTTGQMIVPTQQMGVAKLLELMTHLPLQYGPGFYRFEAVDTGGQGEDKWMVKLGTEVAPTMEGLPMGMQPPFNPPPGSMPGTPLDPGVTQIMPGWFYNETANLLMAPWKKAYSWKMGDPLPDPPPTGSHLSLVPQNASPWSWPGQQQQPWQGGGWGSWPATETKSPELEALKLQLAESERRREEDERRREDRAREDRRAEEAKRDREAADKRFEQILAAITTKPAGPSEAEQRLLRETEETRRRLEESERRAVEDRKEAQRREEARIAEERHREEMRLVQEQIKAATANKADPMMTLFGTILQTQSANATETARMLRESGDRAAAASERNTTQILELARTQRESATESGRAVLEGMKGLMDTSTTFYQQMLEVAGSGSQPWYAGVLQEGVGKIGLLGQALMERNQQAQQQPQYMPPQRIVQGRPVPMQPGMRQMPQQQQPMQQVAPVANTRPHDADYDQATEEFVFPDGWRVKQSVVQQNGWAAVLKKRPQTPIPVAAPVAAPPAPTNGTTAAPVSAPPPVVVAPAPASAPAPVAHAAPAGKRKASNKKKRGRAAAEPEATLPPQPANGVGYSTEEIRAMEPEQVEEVVRPLDDSMLFGGLLPYVTDLRAKAANGLPPEKAAAFILGTRQYIHSFGASPPPAFELLAAEQLEILVERLLPDVTEEYQDAILDIIEKQLDAENPQRGAAEIEAQ
jgi:hypothetical protein